MVGVGEAVDAGLVPEPGALDARRRAVNAAFDLDAPLKIEHEEEGTRLVAGLIRRRQAPYGFYNRGLTLKEGEESPWPHVALKIDSRYLEHTLTRDQVLQDEHYVKAMALLADVATERLPRMLFDLLVEHAASGDLDAWGRWADHALDYASTYGDFEGWRGDAPIFPTVAGEPVSARELIAIEEDRDRALYLAGRDPELARALAEHGVVTLAGAPYSTLGWLTTHARRSVLEARMNFIERRLRREASRELQVTELAALDAAYMGAFVTEDPGALALCEALRERMRAWGAGVELVVPGRLGHVERGRARVCWVCDDHRVPVPAEDVEDVTLESLSGCAELVINVEEPGVRGLLALHERAPGVASHALFERVLRSLDAEDIDEARIHRALYGG